MKYTITDKAPQAIGPYSQAVSYNGVLYLSGSIPLDSVTGNVVGEDIKGQTKQVLKNIDALLKANNIDSTKVIKTTCMLADMELFNQFNEVYSEFFISKPARSCFAVKGLPKNVLVEIELVASL